MVPGQLNWKDIQMEFGTIVNDDSTNQFWNKNFQTQITIFDNLIEHVVIHDIKLRVLWANKSACKSVNLKLEQVVGSFCYTIWPKRTTPCEDCPVNRSRMTGMPQSIEKQTPDGRYWQISASPIFDENEQITAMIELTLDITKRVQAEEDLKRVQNDQEQLIKKRTLSLTRLTEKLKKEIEDHKKTVTILGKQKDYIQQLAMELSKAEDRERQRIAGLLHDDLQQMLAYLKIKFYHMLKSNENIVNFDGITDLIDNCIERCRSLSHDLKPFVSQQKDFIDALKWICRQMKERYELEVALQTTADPEIKSTVLSSLLVRSIRELLFNVVKHSGEKRASLSVRVEDRYMLISVKDSGKGCDPDVLKAKREKDITFGLSDIEERVNFLGGYMDVESTPDKGFKVVLWVPRDVYCPSETGRPIPDIPNSIEIIDEEQIHDHPDVVSDSFARVVIADDHSMMRDGLAELINGYGGIRVVGMAANGKEAIEMAVRLKPRVILMDVNMPVMNGIDATTQINALFPEIRIIGITMHKDTDIHESMINAGAYACLTKSGSTEELINTILAGQSD